MLTLSEWSVPSSFPVNSLVKLASFPDMLPFGLLKLVIFVNIEVYTHYMVIITNSLLLLPINVTVVSSSLRSRTFCKPVTLRL
jgi:hypothetical protein